MKHIPFILLFVFSFSSLPKALAGNKQFGLGVILNNPTGFSAKYRLSRSRSFDVALGYSFGRSDILTIHSTYLLENNKGFKLDKVYIGYYLGAGGGIHFIDQSEPAPFWADDSNYSTAIAIRGVAGLNYYFKAPSLEVFTELALNFFFLPATAVDLSASLGLRYYF